MANLGRLALAGLGILAYQNRDKLKTMLDQVRQGGTNPDGTRSGGGLLDQLGGGGLGELLDRFRATGRGDAVDSWVQQGPNQHIEPAHVESAIDPETLDALSRQTGMSRGEILERLARNLPEVVDEMTPDGKLSEDYGQPTLLDDVPPQRSGF